MVTAGGPTCTPALVALVAFAAEVVVKISTARPRAADACTPLPNSSCEPMLEAAARTQMPGGKPAGCLINWTITIISAFAIALTLRLRTSSLVYTREARQTGPLNMYAYFAMVRDLSKRLEAEPFAKNPNVKLCL